VHELVITETHQHKYLTESPFVSATELPASH